MSILANVHDNSILIPRSALIEGSVKDTRTVFVVEAGVCRLRQVKPGLSSEDIVEITRGLTEGELVVTTGQNSLRDSEKVNMVRP